MLNYWDDFGFDRTLALLDDFRRRMDQAVASGSQGRGGSGWDWPRVAIRDEGTQLVVLAEVPGVSKENLKVSLENDTISLSGERPADVPQGYTVHRRERAPIQFSRTFNLPVKVDAERTRADLKDGILTLTMDKAKEAMPRQITINAG